jgi:anthranilate phosphoribosyltransferase
MKKYFKELIDNQELTKQLAFEALTKIGSGEVSAAHIAGFLSMYAMKGVSVDELEGFRDAMLALAVPIDLSAFDAMDVCGTGGDGKDTFNISTTAAFIIAGTGQRIAKHGNHGVSSLVGSSTVLEYLGVKFTNDESFLKHKLETAGICYMHAPLFHPAMRFVGSIRKELGLKTFFNILGPLLNPAKVQKQLTGVYDQKTFDLYNQLFIKTDTNFGVIYDLGGYDEVSLTDDFLVGTQSGIQQISTQNIGRFSSKELSGGETLEEAAAILVNILENKATKAQSEVAIINAGLGLSVARNISLEEGIAQAKESLLSGSALKGFKSLIV